MPIVQSDLRTKSSGPRLAQQPKAEPRLLRSKTGPYVAPRLATVDSPASRDQNGTIETPERAYSELQYQPSPAGKFDGISPNITPRSDARRSRIQGASPTANSTVGIVAASTWTPTPAPNTTRTGFVRNGQADNTILHAKTKDSCPKRLERQPFFSADNVESVVQSQKPTPSGFVSGPHKSFFYANGEKENDIQTTQDYIYSTSATNPIAPGLDLHALHQMQEYGGQRQFTTSPMETGVSSIVPQRGAPLRRLSSFADRAASAKAQSASATPLAVSRPVSYDRTTQQSGTLKDTRPPSRYSGSSFVQLGHNDPINALDYNSSGILNGENARPVLSPPQANIRPPSPLKMASYAMNPTQSEATAREPSPHRGPDSPSSTIGSESAASKLDRMNELANNARRERKVLDLEISNSSLLAINRTLEKEMRKQTHELRRFRRLMQSGRLSLTELAPMDEDSDEDEEDPSDTSSDIERQDEDEQEGEEQDDESPSSRGKDPDGQYLIHGSKSRRQTDTRRMRLDLSKHQEILNDTRKMNESLRRCLARSEALLKDATSALSHEVPGRELRLGGRVLIPEDEEEHHDKPSRALLSPGVLNRLHGDGSDGFQWQSEQLETDEADVNQEDEGQNEEADQSFEEVGEDYFGDSSFEDGHLEEHEKT